MGTRTQDLIFTLYGDYVRYRGSTAWIGSLIALLGALGTSEQAVRSTASRMARKGWLNSERRGRHSYYTLTPKAAEMLAQGDRQIFYPPQAAWDGHWYLVTYSFSDELGPARHRLRKRLSWLGFGQLASGTWISPRDLRNEVCGILDELGVREHVDCFQAQHICFTESDALAKRCWNLEEINDGYRQFMEKYQPQFQSDCQMEERGEGLSPEHAFKQRFWLVHEYRAFPFADPYLPDDLLPDTWQGHAAVELFRTYYAFLSDKANACVDRIMEVAP
jgi:phenylacetic acid degradation operon negative regulatory protein